MKTVVITGSARGLGLEMAKRFRLNNYNVVLSDINESNLEKAMVTLNSIESEASIGSCVCNVTSTEQISNLINYTIDKLETILSETAKDIDEIKSRRIIERIKYLTIEEKLISKNKRN